MTNDEQIRLRVIHEVCHALKDRNPASILVSCKDGVVTLRGRVEEDTSVATAGMAARRVPGLKGVVNEISVNTQPEPQHGDAELAGLVAGALEKNAAVHKDNVIIAVKDGWVTLSGNVETQEHKKESEDIAGTMPKIRGLTSEINVHPVQQKLTTSDIKNQITEAFHHMAEHHAAAIIVQIEGTKVTLSGVVRAWVEKIEAECIAKQIPGVEEVDNQLELIPMLQGRDTPH